MLMQIKLEHYNNLLFENYINVINIILFMCITTSQ